MKQKIYISIIFLLIGKMIFAQLPDIVQMEYYFDNDPGFGNGTQVSLTTDSIIDIDFDADLTFITIGYHKLFIRVKDGDGKWSLAYKQDVYKADVPSSGQPLPDIVAMEYYFDTDPGFGNGEQISMTSDSLVDVDFTADLSLVDVGYHKLFVRTQDEDGKWSLVFKQDVYKADVPSSGQPLPDIVTMEYYFDTDPGFGNGEQVSLTSDSLVDVDFTADLSLVDVGYHKLFVRTQDENGKWSLVFKQDVYKADVPSSGQPLPDIVALEYFIDTDPGFGMGTNVAITSDSIINEMLIADISGLSVGDHNLLYRVKDENGKWSLTNITPFYLMGLKAFLHGPYDTIAGIMNSSLNSDGLIPLQQPYDSDPAAKWFYEGDESVAEIPNGDIVDWVLVQIRDATSLGNATSSSIIETRPVFLLKDGSLVGLDGFSPLTFLSPVENNLYVVIYHRNHLGVISSVNIPQTGVDAYTYDFTSGENQAYGGNTAHIQLKSGVWGMSSGEGNGDGAVNTIDKNNVWQPQSGTSGYIPGDYNLNGQVENNDKNDSWVENKNKSSGVPD